MGSSEGNAGCTRVAIVNRGEAAVRLIRAVRDLNLEHGFAMRTIAFHTEAERRAVFVLEAIVIRGECPYLDLDELEARPDEVDDEERARLRPDVIEAVQRGMRRTLERA